MQRSELLATVEHLHDVELDSLDRDELVDVVGDTAKVRRWLDSLELRCARQGRALAEAGRAEAPAALMARHAGCSARDADQIARRDRIAEAMPTFETALGDGAVSSGHLDAIANATRHAPAEVRAAFAAHEDELLPFAASDTIDAFARRCRSLVSELTTEHTGNDASELERQRAAANIRTWLDTTDGLHHTHAALDPLRHEIFWTALNRATRRRQQLDGNARTPWNQIQVDALIDAVTGSSTGTATGSSTTTAAGSSSAPTTGPPGESATAPSPPTASLSSSPTVPSPVASIADDLCAAIDRTLHFDRSDHFDPSGHNEHLDHAAPRTDVTDHPVGPEHEPPPEATDADLRRIEQRLPEISVLTDLGYLTDNSNAHGHGICETEDGVPLPISTLRRLCCDAEIIPVVLGGDGIVLDVGRGSRTVTPGQRRALRAMHRTCINPDCTTPFSNTKIHHVRFWTRDTGLTDIDNLVPLCERCHHLVHEGGWSLTMTSNRIATWTRPDGTIHHHGPTIDRPPPGPDPP